MVDDDFDDDDDESDSDEDETAMTMDLGDQTDTMASVRSFASADSSGRLDEMLRLAAQQAGTQGIDFDENGPGVSREEEEEETEELISFKPWSKKAAPAPTPNLLENENVNPFSPAFHDGINLLAQEQEQTETITMEMTKVVGGIVQAHAPAAEEGKDDQTMEMTMTMDMTRAGGRILSSNVAPPKFELEDQTETMDITCAVGRILPTQFAPPPKKRSPTPQSEDDQTMDVTMDMTRAVGRIVPGQVSASLKKIPPTPQSEEDQTMDMTMDMTRAVGRIVPGQPQQPEQDQTETMDITRAVGRILPEQRQPMLPPPTPQQDEDDQTMDMTLGMGGIIQPQAPPAKKRRQSAAPANRRKSTRRASAIPSTDNSGGDETMEFTMVMGGIQHAPPPLPPAPVHEDEEMEDSFQDEDMTMEFTSVVDGVLGPGYKRQSAAARRQSIASESSEGGMDMTVAVGKIIPKTPERTRRSATPKTPSTPLYPDLTPAKAARGMSSPPEKPKAADPGPMYPDLKEALEEVLPAPPVELSRPEAKKVLEVEVDQAELDDVALPDLPELKDSLEDVIPAPQAELSRPEGRQALEMEVDRPELDMPPPLSSKPSSKQSTPKAPLSAAPLPLPTPMVSIEQPEIPETPVRRTRSKTPSSALKPPSRKASEAKSSPVKPRKTPKLSANPPSSSLKPPVRKTPEPQPSPAKKSLPEMMAELNESQTPRKKVTRMQSPVRDDEEKDTENYRPLKGRKSLHVGAAKGILGKRPAELDSDGDNTDDEGGTKRLKNFQGSPVKNVRLQKPPSKEEVTGRMTRAQRRSLEATQDDTLNIMKTPTKSKTPSKASRSTVKTPAGQDRFKDVEKLPEARTPVPFKVDTTMTIPLVDEPSPAQPIQIPAMKLQDFLDMTSIRFMELTTTKRRHTVAPNSLKTTAEKSNLDNSLESCVVAGACTLPMLELFQHSCHELKRYISEGRKVVKEIEQETATDNPPLFQEYVLAGPEMKSVMDTQFNTVKANARLLSKGMWYEWRRELLKGLCAGLVKISSGFDKDTELFAKEQELLDSVLPELEAKFTALVDEEELLKASAEEIGKSNPEELAKARECLVALEADNSSKRQMIAQLRAQIASKDDGILKSSQRKEFCLDSLREAERTRQECRGWSSAEVKTIRSRVKNLEKEYGWTITGVLGTTVSMALKGELECVFDAAGFKNAEEHFGPKQMENSRVDLWYIAASREVDPVELTPEKKFFVDGIRDYIRGMSQADTTIKQLLDGISLSWKTSTKLLEMIKDLNRRFPVIVEKTGDESIVVRSSMLLKGLRSKVVINYHITTGNTDENGEEKQDLGKDVSGGEGLQIRVKVDATAVYGEPFNEESMGRFLNRGVAEERDWVDVVKELEGRLIARGKK